jgi:hypothetical protein
MQYLTTIILINVSAGVGAYVVITINDLKQNRKMWEKAYTELATELELVRLGVMK